MNRANKAFLITVAILWVIICFCNLIFSENGVLFWLTLYLSILVGFIAGLYYSVYWVLDNPGKVSGWIKEKYHDWKNKDA